MNHKMTRRLLCQLRFTEDSRRIHILITTLPKHANPGCWDHGNRAIRKMNNGLTSAIYINHHLNPALLSLLIQGQRFPYPFGFLFTAQLPAIMIKILDCIVNLNSPAGPDTLDQG